VLTEIDVFPEWRGRGFGVMAANAIVEAFGVGFGLVACFPFGINYQTDGEGHVTTIGAGDATSVQEIADHWELLGFRSVPHTGMMILNREERQSIEAVLERRLKGTGGE
jgi:hypothetical protein